VRWVRFVPAAVVLIVAGIGYWQFIPITHVERARLSKLVLARPTAGFKTKPSGSTQVAASSSPFATVKTASKRSPSSTGSYAIEWAGSGSSSDVASMLVSMLPSGSDASAVDAEAKKSYLSDQSLQSDSYSLEGRFAVASVPGAKAATFAKASPTGGMRVSAVVFRVGSFVVVELVQTAGASGSAQAHVISLGRAEYQHLRQLGSGFSLVQVSRPLGASLIYVTVAVVLAVATFFAPIVVRRIGRRRRLAREAAARREILQRGRKIVKRQARRRR
jgi:hypothetical protein